MDTLQWKPAPGFPGVGAQGSLLMHLSWRDSSVLDPCPRTARWGSGYNQVCAENTSEVRGQGTAPFFQGPALPSEVITGLFGSLGSGTAGISGKSASVLSLSPHKSFIEDFSEVWVGSTLVFFLDMGHGEKVSPRVAPRN